MSAKNTLVVSRANLSTLCSKLSKRPDREFAPHSVHLRLHNGAVGEDDETESMVKPAGRKRDNVTIEMNVQDDITLHAEDANLIPAKKNDFYLFFTLPGLVHQTASDLAAFSPHFRVVAMGGKGKQKKRTIATNKGYYRASDLYDPRYFDEKDANTSRTVAVVSYLWNMPKDGEWDQKTNPKWPKLIAGRVRAIILDEAADGLWNRTTFWQSIAYLECPRKLLFTSSPAPRGLQDYASYLALIQTPGFNKEAQQDNPTMDYKAGATDPYDLPDDHPATKYRTAEYCFRRFIIEKDMDEFSRGLKAQKCLSRFVIRQDTASACPHGSENTIARSLPPKRHFVVEKLLSPTGRRHYQRFSTPWAERLMRKDPDRPEEQGTPTPNGICHLS
ncbi:hypothetical protein K505DRAFT_360272 [Melanomma pulvis-pyrius CBS 109.77]|uniref:Uncharacterized protein n=1 Tax=Melanomma pulvis-pyrius CBS 109.77 TaxID=1314802 RepID=A0A6A6XFH9_9PLEO|nr:hypothetical protein K505DRAFT_360272 [Melanomma pulvis-pyrius CBS 109.77]